MNDALLSQNSRDFFSQAAKNRIAMFLLAFFSMITLLVILLVRFTFTQVKEISVAGKEISQGEVSYCLDSVNVSSVIDIVGWAIELDAPPSYANCFVLLKNLENGRYFQLKTTMALREDLPVVFNIDSSRLCGFQAKGSASRLDLTATYQVCLLYFDKLVETDYQFSFGDYTQ